MPYKTVMKKFTDGHMSWMEPEQVWVDPTPEETAAEKAHQAELDATRDDLVLKMDDLLADIKQALRDRGVEVSSKG